MVGLQGLHLGKAFRCHNISACMGLKSFCPWCLKLGGNKETITIHLREVYYRMTIVCNICQAFAGMNAQNILDHQVKCKIKCDKEHAEHEGHGKASKSHKKKEVQVTRTKGSVWVSCNIMLSRMLFYVFPPPTFSIQWMSTCSISISPQLCFQLSPHSVRWTVSSLSLIIVVMI